MSDRFAQLSPRDTAITLRSLPRRIDQAANPALSSDDLSLRVDAPGPNGQSLSELVDAASRDQSVLHNELERALDQENPVVAAAALDPSEQFFVDSRPVPIETALASLKDEANASAERVEGASGSALARNVSVTGGTKTTPLRLAQEAARRGIAALGLINDHVAWMRATRPRG